MMRRRVVAVVLSFLAASSARAQSGIVVPGPLTGPNVILPVSYSMLNGNTGTWRYLDYIYNGSGCVTCDNAALAGGVGLLTDGVAAPNSWDLSAINPPGGIQGFYVGWMLDPVITFFFSAIHQFDKIRIHYDIANTGGVGAPGPASINGITHTTAIPGGTSPFWEEYDIGYINSDLISLTMTRTDVWLMVSEIQFSVDAAVVPEPGTIVLLATGLAGLGLAALRRRRA